MRPKTNPRPQATRPRTAPRPRKRFPSFNVLLLLILISMTGGAVWLRNEIYSPYQHEAAKKTITIDPGASTTAIVARLYEEGVLKHEWPTQIWLRFFPNGERFKAGGYELNTSITS